MKNFQAGDFKAWNEEMVKKYDPDKYHHHPNSLVRYIEAKRVRWIIYYLGLNKEDSLLEAGCGAGNILEGINCKKIFGIDLSPYLLAKAKQKNIPHLQLVNANVEILPFQDKSLGKIICSEVLEHVLNPKNVIKEIHRVLRHEGKAIISIPNEGLINFIKSILIKLRILIMKYTFITITTDDRERLERVCTEANKTYAEMITFLIDNALDRDDFYYLSIEQEKVNNPSDYRDGLPVMPK